ncbi:multidrug ABC transporter permease [Nitrosomonas sp. Is35]|uniref:multidrug ABC transporter permease n=1 Tax=Nitrosomonas sp. Is35 TaxID=3080534 RepID=UPI00294B40E0|nr:multidrug ABC transporter permease [Nitrosomonas sp. Is35]MDV6348152.1 multidrug ABC transporter permease [Nitrosomonas sp. Is35]
MTTQRIHAAMIQILKPLVSFLMFLIVLFSISTILTITTGFPAWLSATVSVVCATFAAWFTWKLVAGERISTLVAVTGGALILGGLFFTLGFLGPMVISKDTSQGSMIGLFIAAPLGLVVGAIGGYVYASRQNAAEEI